MSWKGNECSVKTREEDAANVYGNTMRREEVEEEAIAHRYTTSKQ